MIDLLRRFADAGRESVASRDRMSGGGGGRIGFESISPGQNESEPGANLHGDGPLRRRHQSLRFATGIGTELGLRDRTGAFQSRPPRGILLYLQRRAGLVDW